MLFERIESRAKHFFKDILPESAFDRKKPETNLDEEYLNRLVDEILRQCEEESKQFDELIDKTANLTENFDFNEPNVPLTGKALDEALEALNPQKEVYNVCNNRY